jgi:hypothetical protein
MKSVVLQVGVNFCVCNDAQFRGKCASLHGDTLLMGIMRGMDNVRGKTFARRGAPSRHLTASH